MRKLLLMLTLASVLTACEQEVYDKGDIAYSYLRADFVEAIVGSDHYVSYVVTDDDERLALKMPFTASWIETADTTYRAVLYYNNTGEKPEAVNLSRVSVVPVRRPAQFKSGIKTDPIGFESLWLSGHKRYLNLGVVMKTGAVGKDDEIQTLGVIGDTITVGTDGLRTYHLRLFHNQGDVPEYYSQRAYFSIPVGNLGVDSLRLSVNTYDGVVTKEVRL